MFRIRKSALPLFLTLFFIYTSGQTQPLEKPLLTAQASIENTVLEINQTTQLILDVSIANGWHINANKPAEDYLIPTEVTLNPIPGIEFGSAKYPKVKKITFAFSEAPVLVYDGNFQISIPVTISKDVDADLSSITGKLTYQGCNDMTCMAPADINFDVPVRIKMSDVAAEAVSDEVDSAESSLTSDEQRAKDVIDRGLPYAILFFFLAGLALNLTPCVYPVIPITISYFGAQSEQRKGSLLPIALTYVIGIAMVFAVLGLISGLAGKQWGFLFQNPWFIIVIALIIFSMAASMFGAFEITVPSSLMNKLGGSRKGILGALIMGLTVGVVIAPCAAGLIIGLVGLVAKMGIVVRGTLLFFSMGLGLGLPYLILASFSNLLTKMPRSGMWMVWIRKFFGVLLIGVGFYFIIPQVEHLSDQMSFYFGLISLFGGLLLGFLDKEAGYSRKFNIIRAVIGIFLMIAGVFWLNKAIDSMGQPAAVKSQEELIEFIHYTDEDIAELTAPGKPVFFDFYADWCAPCKKMNKTTFRDSAVVSLSQEFTMVKVDCTKPEGKVKALMEKYNIVGMPTLIFLNPDGSERVDLRKVEYMGPEELVQKMQEMQNP